MLILWHITFSFRHTIIGLLLLLIGLKHEVELKKPKISGSRLVHMNHISTVFARVKRWGFPMPLSDITWSVVAVRLVQWCNFKSLCGLDDQILRNFSLTCSLIWACNYLLHIPMCFVLHNILPPSCNMSCYYNLLTHILVVKMSNITGRREYIITLLPTTPYLIEKSHSLGQLNTKQRETSLLCMLYLYSYPTTLED
jgi:hypothetical protein